jgi:hypothetical protein
MKVLVSLSAAAAHFAGKLPNGTRVAVEYGKNEWYLGTITRQTTSGYRIELDDGVVESVKIGEGDVRPIDPKQRKLKTAQTRAKVVELYKAWKAQQTPVKTQPPKTPPPKPAPTKTPKPEPTKPPRTAPPKTQPPKTPVPTKPPVKVDPNKTKTVVEQEEQTLWAKLGRPTFAVGDRNSYVRFMRESWNAANRVFFESRMNIPKLELMRNGTTARTLGYWHPVKDLIKVTPKAFNGTPESVLAILVHEMCHQAVSRIDKVIDNSQGGHGPRWQAWMSKCGLDPKRYADQDMVENTLTEEEKKNLADFREKTAGKELVQKPKEGNVVQFQVDGVWHFGVVSAPYNTSKKKWYVIGENDQLWTVPSVWLFRAPIEDISRVAIPERLEKAKLFRQSMEQRKQTAKLIKNGPPIPPKPQFVGFMPDTLYAQLAIAMIKLYADEGIRRKAASNGWTYGRYNTAILKIAAQMISDTSYVSMNLTEYQQIRLAAYVLNNDPNEVMQ